MPAHVRFLLVHAGIGVLIALVFAALILWFDIAGIRHLVLNTDEGPLALGVFVVLCAITFGSAQMGIRIMLLGNRPEQDSPD